MPDDTSVHGAIILQPAGALPGPSDLRNSKSGVFAASASSGAPALKERTGNAIRSESSSSKRPRFESPRPPEVGVPKPSGLSRLPVELLAEILLYFTSTKVLLNVARSSKDLCLTLVDPASSFIWRGVRGSCCVPIPDPTPNFTEPAYAAFIFDGGECEVCNKATRAIYCSFALRVRLCGNRSCYSTFRQVHCKNDYDVSGRALLSAESTTCFSLHHNGFHTSNWPESGMRLCRASDYEEAYAGPTWDINEHKFEIEKRDKIMAWAVQLSKWKEKRTKLQASAKEENEALACDIATKEGWSQQDMLQTQTFGRLHRTSADLAAPLRMDDFRLVRSSVDEEMIKMAEARKRRADEETYRNLYRELERQYNRIKSQNSKDKILPTLAQFRQLPVIKLVQSQQTPASTDVSRDLKSGLLADMLEGDLDKWSKTAKEAFGEMLGFPGYRSASKTKLHPVDRVTARFRCKRCRKEGWKYAQDGCLDFPGVCAHVCHDSSMEKRTRERWNPDHFEADEKVIRAIRMLLILANLDEETADSLSIAQDVGQRVQCLSCKSRLVMDFQTMMCHAHRHDSMELQLLPASESAAPAPVQTATKGICAKLMRPIAQAKAFRRMQNYGCRHCRATASTPITEAGGASDIASTSVVTKSLQNKPNIRSGKIAMKSDPATRLFTFDGLVSHVKERHGVTPIGDEDLFCQAALGWKK